MKNIIKQNIRKVAIGLLLFSTATSCVDLDIKPYDRLSDIQYWEKEDAALLALNNCYANLTNIYEILYSDAMSDNAYCKVQAYNQAIGNGSHASDNSYVLSIWSTKYAGIRACNILLDNIDKATGLSSEAKNRYKSEAQVIRAFFYFELYSKFGDIPYFTSTITLEESQTIQRTSKSTIVENLLTELGTIIDNNYLPESYSGVDKGRVTRYAAMALKARVLLFEGRYAEVKTETAKILDKFTLYPSYEGLFYASNEGNLEIILDVQYMLNTREHRIQYEFLPPSLGGYAQLAPLQELVDSYIATDGKPISTSADYSASQPFLNRDPRLAATIVYNGNSYLKADGSLVVINTSRNSSPDGYGYSSDCTPTGYYFKKYWDKDHRESLNSGLNVILIRYADVLLMHAEAAAETGTLDEATWNKTIKSLRQRAGFSKATALNFPSVSNAELVEIVRRERRSELAFEGLRHKDIMRWEIAETVLNGYCHGLYTGDAIGTDNGFVRVENRNFDKTKHYLLPIPRNERDLNSNLTQNPNW
jgi:starch-binding outer membrane protein, SusD/RagB family